MTDKASRATVQIGNLTVDGFMLPDRSYRMSLTQAGECIGKPARSIFDFFKSKAVKRMLRDELSTFDFLPASIVSNVLADTYTADQFFVDIGEQGIEGQTRIRGLPLNIVVLYWAWESFRGNKQAFSLILGLLAESLERRFDSAFNINRTEQEWNDRLAQQVQELERDLTRLGESYAMEDEVRDRLTYLESWLQERGLNPWNASEEGDA